MGLTKEAMANDLAPLIGLPIMGKRGKAFRAVRGVFEAMRDALLRGETVRVLGFGTFKVRERAARRKNCFRAVGRRRWTKSDYREIMVISPRKYVAFKPHPDLLRFIDNDY